MKLLAAISDHGLGHLAQAGPVLDALGELLAGESRASDAPPALELTIWSGLSAGALAARIGLPFVQRVDAADVGLVMGDAVHVDISASHAGYLGFHADWESRVAREADWLKVQGFDAVFADVSYLPLAAAAQAGIPAVALCSLNWLDIALAYLHGQAGMDRVFVQMAAAYDSVRAFLQATPAMPMAWLARREVVPPIAGRGVDRRRELANRLRLAPGQKLVLVGFGGIAYRGREILPRLPEVVWLVADDDVAERTDLAPFRRLHMPFLDLLASSDALLTKLGYGSFVEAASHGVPVLYVDRPDWPETPWLAAWLKQYGNGLSISEAQLFAMAGGGDAAGYLAGHLDSLWAQPGKTAPKVNGAEVAARRLLQLIT